MIFPDASNNIFKFIIFLIWKTFKYFIEQFNIAM